MCLSTFNSESFTLSVDLKRVEGDQRLAFSGIRFLMKLKRGPEHALTDLAKMRWGDPSTLLTWCPRTFVTRANLIRTSAGLQAYIYLSLGKLNKGHSRAACKDELSASRMFPVDKQKRHQD